MTLNEISVLFVMMMGLFAIDMLVAEFNLNAGRIVAVLTFFVLFPLGLIAGIIALICMNNKGKQWKFSIVAFGKNVLFHAFLLNIILLYLLDTILLKIFPDATFPVVFLSFCFSPVFIVLVAKALLYLKEKVRKPKKKEKIKERVVSSKMKDLEENIVISKPVTKSTATTNNHKKTVTNRPVIPSGYATPRHDPYAVSDDYFRYDPDYQDYLQGNIRPERYRIEHRVADNGQEYTTLKSEKTELAAFYREQNEKAAEVQVNKMIELVIPEGTTEIGEREFQNREDIISVVVPKSVIKIGEYAFCVCKNLKSVVIAEGVKEIGDEAFRYCENLESVVIPDSVTKIGAGAFRGCKSLISVNIPKSVDKIADSLFWGCEKLSSSVIHNRITDIGQNAFAGCANISSIVIPDSVKTIGKAAFCQCTKLASVEIPKSIQEIEEATFSDCENLTEVTVESAGVTRIGNFAFNSCRNLSLVKLHNGVITIGVSAFGKCNSLSSVVIPDSVVWLGGYAFEHCVNLTHIALPKNLKSMGGYAFFGCENLNSIDIPENIIPNLCSNGSLSGCSALKSFKIPYGVTEIANSMFSNCEKLTMVELPNTVERIGSHAFSGCKNLEYVYLPDSVQTIGEDAFKGCDKISDDIKGKALAKIPRIVPVATSYNTPYDDPQCDDNFNPDKYNYELRVAQNGREYYARIN